MKRMLLLATVSILATTIWAQPQVAVLDASVPQSMDTSVVIPVTDKIIEKLVQSGRFTVLDRANIDSVLKEREFQVSGLVNDQDIVTAGKYLGADFVVAARVQKLSDTYFLSGKMISVKTGIIVNQTSAQKKGQLSALIDLADQVGATLAGEETAESAPPKAAAPAAPAPAPAPAPPPVPAAQKIRWNQAPALPIVLNLVPGFGVGSFVQRDSKGGIICAVGDGVGYGLIYVGYIYLYVAAIESVFGQGSGTASTGGTLILAGSIVFAGSKIFGIARPIKHYNDLKEQYGISFGFAPTVMPVSYDGRTIAQPGALFSLSY